MGEKGVALTGVVIVVAICSFMIIIGILGSERTEPANETIASIEGTTVITCPNPDCLYHDTYSVSEFEITYDSNNRKIIYYCQRCRTQWEVER